MGSPRLQIEVSRGVAAELDLDLRHAELAVQQPGDNPALIKDEVQRQGGCSLN